VAKFQPVRVEKMPVQVPNCRPGYGIEEISRSIPAIEKISHHGVPDLGQMDPDLVRPASLYPNAEQGKRPMLGLKAVVSNGIAAPPGANGDLFSVPDVSAQREVYRSRSLARASVHQGQIFFSYLAAFKLERQSAMGWQAFRHHHQAACQFVEAVNDTRPHGISGRQRSQVEEQRVDQRSGAYTGAGVADHARGFFHHGQVGILINQMERNLLGLGRQGRDGLRYLKHYGVAGPQQIAGFHACVIDENVPDADPSLNLRAALFRESSCQIAVQSNPSCIKRNPQALAGSDHTSDALEKRRRR
jgi:hypothetical protein